MNAHSASLGFPIDHGPAILTSGMSDEYAGRVALLMQAVLACAGVTTKPGRMDCAGAVMDAAAGVIRTEAPPFKDVQAWPSLYIDGDGSNDVYVHDYAVLIDRGGNDVYDNNAGGNLLDIRFGPKGSAAPNVGPAIGCEQVHGQFPRAHRDGPRLHRRPAGGAHRREGLRQPEQRRLRRVQNPRGRWTTIPQRPDRARSTARARGTASFAGSCWRAPASKATEC